MEHSLILRKNGKETTFDRRGVADLYQLLNNHPEKLKDATVIDKAVGKAAAALMILGGIREVRTPRISSPALALLRNTDIRVIYDEEVPLILNRTMSDSCPLEKRCKASDNLDELSRIIGAFIKEMQSKQN